MMHMHLYGSLRPTKLRTRGPEDRCPCPPSIFNPGLTDAPTDISRASFLLATKKKGKSRNTLGGGGTSSRSDRRRLRIEHLSNPGSRFFLIYHGGNLRSATTV